MDPIAKGYFSGIRLLARSQRSLKADLVDIR